MSDIENIQKLAESEDAQVCSPQKKSALEILMGMCEDIELFHSHSKESYATVIQNNHKENWSLKSSEFKSWLRQKYYSLTSTAPAERTIQDVIQTLSAKALFEGLRHEVFLRVAHLDDKIYIDLANEDWEVVEINSQGFSVRKDSPVKFRRVSGMEPLPAPIYREHPREVIKKLRLFLNVETEDDFKLLIGWLISTLGINGPYIVLVLYGEQGTAKSTSVKVLRSFVDPNISPLRRPPKNTDDLMVMAKANYIVALDNMSYLPDWLSDDLCVLSTGGGISKRKHYSDDDEIVLDAKRPVIANGIDEFVARGDLANRSIFLHLPVIQGQARKSEKEFWLAFNQAYPEIFGAILWAVVQGLKENEATLLSEKPRMADAWRFITAAEVMLGWPQGSCLNAFKNNQIKANEVILNSSPLYPMVKSFSEAGFIGTPHDLMTKIKSEMVRLNFSYSEQRLFPTNPKTLSDRLRRLAPALRLDGVEIIFEKTAGSNSKRLIRIIENENLASHATQEI